MRDRDTFQQACNNLLELQTGVQITLHIQISQNHGTQALGLSELSATANQVGDFFLQVTNQMSQKGRSMCGFHALKL